LGDGTQASFQPSLKSVESVSGRQESGSGLPKIDWVIVSKSPVSTLGAVGAEPSPAKQEGTAPVGWTASSNGTGSAKEGAEAAGRGSWAAPGRAIAPTRSQANVPTTCTTSAGEMRAILHLPLGQAAVADHGGTVERTMVWSSAAHSTAVPSFIRMVRCDDFSRHGGAATALLKGISPATVQKIPSRDRPRTTTIFLNFTDTHPSDLHRETEPAR
jgi:hypothetical protein